MTDPTPDGSHDPTWRAVDPEPAPPPPLPVWAKVAGAGALVALISLGLIIGVLLGGRGGDGASPSPTPTPTPPLTMEPPVQVGDLVRGEIRESRGPSPTSQRIVRADYTDGTDTVLFVMTWPEPDVEVFLANAGIEDAEETDDGIYCGTSLDTSEAACGRVVDDTGLLVVSVTSQSQPQVAGLLQRFEQAVGA